MAQNEFYRIAYFAFDLMDATAARQIPLFYATLSKFKRQRPQWRSTVSTHVHDLNFLAYI